MASYTISPIWGAGAQLFDNSGNVLSGGKIYTYAAGTTTPATTYTTPIGSVANSNPIIANSAGRLTNEIWFPVSGSYKFVLKDANDVLLATYDNIPTTPQPPIVNDASSISYQQGYEVNAGNFTIGATYLITTVGTTDFVSIGAAANVTGILFTATGVGSGTGKAEYSRTVQSKLRETVSVKDFGAVGDGVTNDTVAIQAAIDALPNGGVIYFPTGEYRIARNIGTHDRWGIKVPQSNITLKGEQASLRRFNTDISTYALAYPILFLGTPDSNVAAATENIVVDGLTFIGEDTRHAISGSYLSDFRDAITLKNTNGTLIQGCTFTQIDSQAITYEWPHSYDYANSSYFNTTKNYNSKVVNCSFIAESHSTAFRALIHAIALQGVDFCVMDSNYFEWCDDAASGEGTYGALNQSENDVYNAGGGFGNVKRSGRNWVFSNNTVYNSSEHYVYLSSMDVVISNNTCRTDEPTICAGDIKTRSQNCTVSGNTVVSGNDFGAISVGEGAAYVTISNNTIYSPAEFGGGSISLSTANLSTYINNRPWFSTYFAMSNISITGNSILMPTTAAPSSIAHIGIRIYTAASDANYPEGQITNLTISGNTFENHYNGIFFYNALTRNVSIDGNAFLAKPFTSSGFNSGSTMNTNAAVAVLYSSTSVLQYVKFSNNAVRGSNYVFATDTGGGTNVESPWGIQANKLDYIKNFKSADMKTITYNNGFVNNTGLYFLDRTGWAGNTSLQNAMNDGTNSSSALKYNIQYTGSEVRFYTNDSGTYITLGP